MKYDFSRLRGKIREVFMYEYVFADKLGQSQPWLSKILNGETPLEQKKISEMAELLGIKRKDIGDFFFKPMSKDKWKGF